MLFRTSNIMEIFCTFIQVQKLKELSKSVNKVNEEEFVTLTNLVNGSFERSM